MLKVLYEHMAWADAVVWTAALGAPADKAIKDKLHHIHMVQHAYLDLWHGRMPQLPGPSAFDDLPGLLLWAREAHRQMSQYMQGAGEDSPKLDAPLQIPWAARLTERLGRAPAAITLRESMIQIPEHSTYHRGQVNMRLRELGVEPPLTDFIAWAWFGKPKPEWPGVSKA